MYQFTALEVAKIIAVFKKALAIARSSPYPVPIAEEEAARQFLAREILRMHREGPTEPDVVAYSAVAVLRNFVQARESAQRKYKATADRSSLPMA